MAHLVIISNRNSAVGAKNRKAEFSNLDDARAQFEKWIKWLDARKMSTNVYQDVDGYIIQLVIEHDIDYDTHN
jgi:hypothetical protein